MTWPISISSARNMIRKATIQDIPMMISLQRTAEEENAIYGYQADDAEDWAERDLKWTLLALQEGLTVAFIHCLPRPYDGECVFAPESKILEILDLVVTPQYRGSGIGHRLVQSIHSQGQQDGYTNLRVYSAARRFDDIVRFYRTCGFKPWYVEMTQEIGAEQPD